MILASSTRPRLPWRSFARCGGAALLAAALLAGRASGFQNPFGAVKDKLTAVRTSELSTELQDAWFTQHRGRIARASSPHRPAVLLVHGLHSGADDTWLRPSRNMLSETGKVTAALDWRNHPGKERIGERDYPGVGIFGVGISEPVPDVDRDNWFDYLARLNLTVATWSQPGETIGDAWPSMQEAFSKLAQSTEGPIVLVGHSRGGLLIRKLLKEGGDVSRVRMVVTLCSPHQGSELGNGWGEIAGEMVDASPGAFWEWAKDLATRLSPGWRDKVKERVVELLQPFNNILLAPGSVELHPESITMRNLASGETSWPWIDYHTFGGVNPNYARFYVWVFTARSAVPQYRIKKGRPEQYFEWRVRPVEIDPLSPFLACVRNLCPEIVPGKGDGLVADARARLPLPTFRDAVHETLDLNHAEVLWNRGLQMKVAQLIANLMERVAGEERSSQSKGGAAPYTGPILRRE